MRPGKYKILMPPGVHRFSLNITTTVYVRYELGTLPCNIITFRLSDYSDNILTPPSNTENLDSSILNQFLYPSLVNKQELWIDNTRDLVNTWNATHDILSLFSSVHEPEYYKKVENTGIWALMNYYSCEDLHGFTYLTMTFWDDEGFEEYKAWYEKMTENNLWDERGNPKDDLSVLAEGSSTLSPSVTIISPSASGSYKIDEEINFKATVSNLTGTTYSWDFGDGSTTSTDTSPNYTYTSTGEYTVTLTVTDASGVNIKETFTINVTDGDHRLDPKNLTTKPTSPKAPEKSLNNDENIITTTTNPEETSNPVTSITDNGTNQPPSKPELVYPEDKATDIDLDILLKWKHSIDPENDKITYHVYLSKDKNPLNEDSHLGTLAIFKNNYQTIYILGFFFLIPFWFKRGKNSMFMAIFLCCFVIYLNSCRQKGANNKIAKEDNAQEETDVGSQKMLSSGKLDSKTVYYWQVVAADDKGNKAESKVFQFTTK